MFNCTNKILNIELLKNDVYDEIKNILINLISSESNLSKYMKLFVSIVFA